ncbi:hypothetical protein LSCM4_07985 [Leishmania orientalis]|uniref:Uncharacterized protein n=1 Tax=Leishmania orientalis TaxID=2249476 RepID=A0A836L0D7_9TRYP|nr:hypothetical protein LSCM4_07985 [Leishmania orientalis]
MPRNAIIVLDDGAMGHVMASTMGALTGAEGGDNKLIVPEPALDFFDEDAKARTVAASGSATAGTSPTHPMPGDQARRSDPRHSSIETSSVKGKNFR